MNKDNVKYSNTCISDLCIEGNVNVIKDYVDRYAYHSDDHDIKLGVHFACKRGDMNIINLLIDITNKKDENLPVAFEGACQGHHMDIVELMLSKETDNMFSGFYGACQGGHMDIIELMISKGIKSWNGGLKYACCGGHMNIIQFLIEKGANDWDWGLEGACRGGHMNIAKLMISKGADNLISGFLYMCKEGNLENIKIMYEFVHKRYFTINFDNVWTGGYPDIIEYFISKGHKPDKIYDFPYKNKKTKFYHNDMYCLKQKKDFIRHSILYWTIVYNEYHRHNRKLLENDLIPILLKLLYFKK